MGWDKEAGVVRSENARNLQKEKYEAELSKILETKDLTDAQKKMLMWRFDEMQKGKVDPLKQTQLEKTLTNIIENILESSEEGSELLKLLK
jgi:hypothetical protein